MYIFHLFIFLNVLHVAVVDISSGGWTNINDEGSTELDHSPATVHNQTGKFSKTIMLNLLKLLHFPNHWNVQRMRYHRPNISFHKRKAARMRLRKTKHHLTQMGEIQEMFPQLKITLRSVNLRMRILSEPSLG